MNTSDVKERTRLSVGDATESLMLHDVILDASSIPGDATKRIETSLQPCEENEDWKHVVENARLDDLLHRMEKAHASNVPTRQSSQNEFCKV